MELLDAHGRTLIFKLGGGNTATVVCWDFASAISVLADSSSSTTVEGDVSGRLGPEEDGEDRKIVETRFMAIVERWGLEGFRGGDWRCGGDFIIGRPEAVFTDSPRPQPSLCAPSVDKSHGLDSVIDVADRTGTQLVFRIFYPPEGTASVREASTLVVRFFLTRFDKKCTGRPLHTLSHERCS